ncbi:MAG: hypothetical protein NC111_03930, partial [Bacteroides sp.]|nr:hypothetical protein [Bacteroides sp.]MCM1413915.1 hypothetical protein [Bacteroides sp.]MCM1471658.1 hypothetical protein [Bacteroides sp.]
YDLQGNIVAVYNTATQTLVQTTDYYPYGLPHATSTNYTTSSPATNRRKYGAKELQTDLGLNLYDFEARYQNPVLPHFTTPDPLATDYHLISPYTYCAADPINLIDPSGMNIYSVDSLGNYTMIQVTNDDFDTIYSNGDFNNSIQTKKGAFQKLFESDVDASVDTNQEEAGSTHVEIYGSGYNIDRLFEFLYKNTIVEWSYVQIDDSGKIKYYLGTSHKKNSDYSMEIIFESCILYNYGLIEATHNHTNGNLSVSKGDNKMAIKIQELYPNALLYIITSDGKKLKYDRNTYINELSGLTVTPK